MYLYRIWADCIILDLKAWKINHAHPHFSCDVIFDVNKPAVNAVKPRNALNMLTGFNGLVQEVFDVGFASVLQIRIDKSIIMDKKWSFWTAKLKWAYFVNCCIDWLSGFVVNAADLTSYDS